MPNAREVLWKHVLQETAEEFLGRQDVRLQAVAIAAIAVVVTDLAALAIEQAVIADGHAMRVTCEVIQQLARPGKRRACILPIITRTSSSSVIPTIRCTANGALSSRRKTSRTLLITGW